jgi:hypothetical protein
MRILFVAPVVAGMVELVQNAELARVASGNQISVCDGTVDRAKLSSFLRPENSFDVVHFAQHGQRLGLELSDGTLDVGDLVSMLANQRTMRLLFVNACQSVATGIELHNAFHVPVLAHDAPIGDGAAVAFAETFYRAMGSGADIGTAFGRGLRTLQVRFPCDARTPQIINGDMASEREIHALLKALRAEMNARLDVVEGKVDALNDMRHWRIQLMIVGLLALLVVAQFLTPVLNSLLIHLGS